MNRVCAVLLACWLCGPVLAEPVPSDVPAATLVSLDLKQASPQQAVEALNLAAHTALTFKESTSVAEAATSKPARTVTLHAQNRPLLEVLLQIREQLHLGTPSNQTSEAMVVGGSATAEEIGDASIAGPFGFIVNSIGHTVTLKSDGMTAKEDFGLRVQLIWEPTIRILGMPQGIAVVEAKDDKGQSLVDDKAPAMKPGFTTYPNATFPIALKHPEAPGRKIAILKAHATVLAALGSESIVLKDPANAQPVSRTMDGCKITLGPLTPGARGQQVALTLEQGSMNEEMWQNVQQAFKRLDGTLGLGGTSPRKVTPGTGVMTGSGGTVTFTYPFSTSAPRGGTGPEVTDLTVELPTAIRVVQIPIEFHDLPIP